MTPHPCRPHEGSVSWEFRAVVKVWPSKRWPRNWDCLYSGSTSEDFTVSILDRPNRISEKLWRPLINCLHCVYGSMKLRKVLPHRLENRMGACLREFLENFLPGCQGGHPNCFYTETH